MPGIVDFPQIVKEAMEQYRGHFANECQLRHFGEYLTGLLIADRKSVLGMNSEFAQTTDQSCLNRFMTEVEWDEEEVNDRRLEILQEEESTRYSPEGVIPLDNTLIDHEGKLIEDVGWYWDHAEERNKLAHDYLFINYVCPSKKHYPLHFRRFRKEQDCAETGDEFRNHTDLAIELIDWVCGKGIPGHFTYDCYFTSARVLNQVHAHDRAYVGDLKANRNIFHKGEKMQASAFAALVPVDARKLVQYNERMEWYFTKSFEIPEVNHRVRLVFIWKDRTDKTPTKILITNQTRWEIHRILGVYGKRWTGTETFHRDAKQHLGMGACQLRDGRGQTRHMHLVNLAYTSLMTQLRSSRSRDWALARLTTIGEACRAVLRETLRKTIEWVIQKVVEENYTGKHVQIALGLA